MDEIKGDDGGAPPPADRPRVVALPTMPKQRKLTDAHLANLRASGLTDETIHAAELYTEDRPKVLAEIVQRRAWARIQGSALVFPFYRADNGALYGMRVRPTVPLMDRGKNGKPRPRKYDQAWNAGMLVYFTPRARAAGGYSTADVPLYWTEGEKKALVFDQLGYTCVGLTGVWNWIDKPHRKATGAERLAPAITECVTLAARHHVIVFDADAHENDHVMMAAQRLAGMLCAAGAASVRFVCPPDAATKGIDDYYAAHGEAATRAVLAAALPIEPIDPAQPLSTVRRCGAYRDAEAISPALRVPAEYVLQRDGSLWRLGTDDKHGDAMVSPAPIIPTRVMSDLYTGEQRVDLAWLTAGEIRTLCASRRAISDSRTLVAELAAFGAPVSSTNAGKLVEWLDAFMHTNAAQLPTLGSVSNTGWHTVDGARVFVANEPIAADPAATPVMALDTRGDRRRLFAALTPRGDQAKHCAALQRAWCASPIAAAIIAGAFAAPLLEPLGAPNFAIHLVGESSRGKTSMLRMGASVYGDPAAPQWLASWNATLAGAEARAAMLCDLPQCYDEIGGGDAQLAERMLYGLINGGGRTRATREMTTRETPSWRTIVLSTGEREMADEGTATGAQVRVVQLSVDGFGGLTAAEVDALRADCAANAGAAGRAWLQWLAAVDDWPYYRDALANITAKLRATATDPLQGRVAGYFGVLSLTEAMMTQVLGIGRGGVTLGELFQAGTERDQAQGIAQRAREAVEAWITTEPDAFPELQLNTYGGLDEPKSNGARQRHGFRRPDGTILVIASAFRTLCKRSRLASREVVREWTRLGWTEVDSGRLDKQVKIGNTRARYIVLTTPTAADSPTQKVGERW